MKETLIRPELQLIIKGIIKKKGKISFHDFMEVALYHPEHGYYMSSREKIGKDGDFYTSPDVHKVFGTTIMKQLKEMQSLLPEDRHFHIIEAGAGKGSMCRQILDAAKEREPSLYESIRYSVVEKSAALMEVQKEGIGSAGHIEKVSWQKDMASALRVPQSAVVISNELIDAFPVHRVVFSGGRWKEIFVTLADGNLSEVTTPLSDPSLEACLSKLEGPFDEGYKTEVNLDGVRWIKNVGENLKQGFLITIDYGYPRADYYSPLRNDGTLLCYYRHSTTDNPYTRVGQQDITAHVDFSSLAEAGREAGLELTGFCEQFHFLMGLGVFDELSSMDEREDFDSEAYRQNMAIKRLLMPEAMGGVFKVLIQHKGLDEKPALKAFSFKELSHRL
ncbi:MAG: SAM-dependent methyltransferase [bacterium]|nr:SAM-dependent methyltransferase [bacterium]